MTAPEQYLSAIKARYAAAADPQKAEPMASYMKHKFDFYGIKSPDRQGISKAFIIEQGIPERDVLKQVCRLCFQPDEKREIQYFVNDLLQKAMRQLDDSFLPLIEELIPRCVWWDSVDFLAPKLAGALFLKYPDQMIPFTERWIESDNFWYQRAALIFQLSYKDKTNEKLLFDYVQRRAGSTEFFVQKGAGWALRQYSKVNPERVRTFLKENQPVLSPLTIREGGKYV